MLEKYIYTSLIYMDILCISILFTSVITDKCSDSAKHMSTRLTLTIHLSPVDFNVT